MAVSSSVSTGVAQSGEWSVCMCRSTWMKSPAAELLAHGRCAVRVVAARGDALVELLELVGHARPVDVRARGVRSRVAKPDRSFGSRSSRSSWAASVSASRGSNSRPSSPSRRSSSYCGSRDTTGTAPPAMARSTSCGAGAGAGGGRHGDRRAREVLGLRAVGGPGEASRARAGGATARASGAHGRIAQPDRGAPVEVGGQAPERAQEQPQRAALLLVREHDLGRGPLLRRRAPAGPRPGGSPCSRRGSSAR